MEIRPGLGTGSRQNVTYRLDKLAAVARVTGHWLDCGGCDGNYAAGLLDRGAERVTVTDIDPARIDQARDRWGHDQRFTFVACAAEQLPFSDEAFDGVLLNEVLEHVEDENRALWEIHRVTRRGGVLALYSPSRRFPFEGHGLNIFGRPLHAPAPLVPWLPKRLTAPFVKARNYWPRELREQVRTHGFNVVAVDHALPVLTDYQWLPPRWVAAYQRNLRRIDRSALRHLGVSTLVVGARGGPGDRSA